MSALQDRVRGLSETQIEALKCAQEENGLLGSYLPTQTYRALRRRGLAEGRYLTPVGVAVREYLITRATG